MTLVCLDMAGCIPLPHFERKAKEKKLVTSVGLTGRKALDDRNGKSQLDLLVRAVSGEAMPEPHIWY